MVDLIARGLGATDTELGLTSIRPEYRVYLRNGSYQIIEELTDWISLSLIKRFNAKGSWRLVLHRASPLAALLTKQSGIVVRRNNVAIFSGMASRFETTATTLTVDGDDDMALLDLPCLPDPAGPPYLTEYNVQPGLASSVLIQLVQYNIGPNARADRLIPELVLEPNPFLGSLMTVSARFDNLLLLLQDIAVSDAAGGLRFEIIHSEELPWPLRYTVSSPRDKRADAVFSVAGGTAADYRDTWESPPANYFYVASGDQLGAKRTILEGGNTASIAEVGRQIEAFVDARGTTDGGELNRKLQEAIAGAVPSRKVTVTPFQTNALQFVDDYDLGDLVTFVADGVTFDTVVREVQIALTTDKGVVITPMIGDAGTTNNTMISRHLQAIVQRVGNLERNWNIPNVSLQRPMLAEPLKPPIGEISAFAGTSAPVGWVIANGDALSRGTYSVLFAVIGTTYGVGDGASTFNVPDLRNRVVIGSGGTYATGATGTLPHDAHDHAHTHNHQHQHDVDLDHDHPNQTIAAASGSGGSANLNALGATTVQTTSATTNPLATASGTAAAAYSGANTSYVALLMCIYSGI